ncbi:MAG: triose-phosphate isomerase [Alphaproteobacteria bacterium]|nr:triose-phosphate isomerase [Alphaproteobacteria bacterium]
MKIIAGNWKMNGSQSALNDMINAIIPVARDVRVMLFVPYTMLRTGADNIYIGAQNVSKYESGAHTGEISAAMVRDMGATATLVGHSEVRDSLRDTNADVALRAEQAINNNLTPIICVGETDEELQSGTAIDIIVRAVRESVPHNAKNGDFIIAYEPRWAIGRGITPSAQEILNTHKIIRDTLIDMGFDDTPILYGASVNAQNAREIMRIKNVDGVLVGGASLKKQDFIPIIESAK